MPISYGKPANKDEIKVLERKFKTVYLKIIKNSV
jgi:hypothetical protein